MKIFITGTDTDIGKTIVSAWLCMHLNAYYWKPIQSGYRDSLTVQNLLNGDKNRILPEQYVFSNPVSPHLAAHIENKNICLKKLDLPYTQTGRLIVEGAGGVLVPLNNEQTILSLIKKLKIPVIIVASTKLGTINHTCLTIEILKKENVPILGVIMNGSKDKNNKVAIEKFGKISVLDELESFKSLDYSSLKARNPSKKLFEAVNDFSTIK